MTLENCIINFLNKTGPKNILPKMGGESVIRSEVLLESKTFYKCFDVKPVDILDFSGKAKIKLEYDPKENEIWLKIRVGRGIWYICLQNARELALETTHGFTRAWVNSDLKAEITKLVREVENLNFIPPLKKIFEG